jgi:hypothetical protein
MCAVWMCSPPAFQAAVAAPGLLEPGPAERGPAERGPAESSDSSPAARARSHGSTRVSPAQGAVPRGAVLKGGNTAAPVSQRPAAAQGGASPLTRNNADRLHSLLRTQARPVAKPPGRPAAASSRAETNGAALGRTPGLQGASPASLSRFDVPKISARPLRSSNAPTPGALVGGPHPGGSATLGGPATGRAASGGAVVGGPALGRAVTANRAMLDGTQMRRKFR